MRGLVGSLLPLFVRPIEDENDAEGGGRGDDRGGGSSGNGGGAAASAPGAPVAASDPMPCIHISGIIWVSDQIV